MAGTVDDRSLGEHGVRRKTLDDIRREIEAEFGPSIAGDVRPPPDVDEDVERQSATDAREVVFDHFKRLRGERRRSVVRRSRRTRYFVAGVIGCLAGQIGILGYLLILIHKEPVARAVGGPAPVISAVSPRSPAVPTSESAATRTGSSMATLQTPAAPPESKAMAEEPPDSTAPPQPSIPAHNVAPAEPIAAPSVRPAPRALSRRGINSVPPSEPRGPQGAEDSAQSQAAVRVALGDWLIRSGLGETLVGETIVFLSPDGRTARTHVAVRSGTSVTLHEQRWARGADGWSFLSDREASRDR